MLAHWWRGHHRSPTWIRCRYGLLFERFLNRSACRCLTSTSDFCQDRREETIRYVQQRYGADRVAQSSPLAACRRARVLRDVGRVLQMPYGQVDKICKLVPNNPANPVTLEEAIEMEPMFKRRYQGRQGGQETHRYQPGAGGAGNRNASTHAAVRRSATGHCQNLVPLYRDPKSDMPVVQYS